VSHHFLFCFPSAFANECENFIMHLERDYPATVSIIACTCTKVMPKEGSDGVCLLCEQYVSPHISVEKYSANMCSFQTHATWYTGVQYGHTMTPLSHCQVTEGRHILRTPQIALSTSQNLPLLCVLPHIFLMHATPL
jgi:cytoplasmic tRNA 2-thiolation protein 2